MSREVTRLISLAPDGPRDDKLRHLNLEIQISFIQGNWITKRQSLLVSP